MGLVNKPTENNGIRYYQTFPFRAETRRACALPKSPTGRAKRWLLPVPNSMSFLDEMNWKRPECIFCSGVTHLLTCQERILAKPEIIRDRLKQHKTKEFWVSAIVFVSKDENLTKAHVRYLESRLLAEAAEVNRFTLEQNQSTGFRGYRESGPRGHGGLSLRHSSAAPGARFRLLSPSSTDEGAARRLLFCRRKRGQKRAGSGRRQTVSLCPAIPAPSWSSALQRRAIRLRGLCAA